MKTKNRLACLAFVLAAGVACSSGTTQPVTTGQESGTPAAAQAPYGGAPLATGQPGQPAAAPAPYGGQPEAGAVARAAPPAATAATPAPVAPQAPPRPQFREVTVPAGTTLNVTLETAVSSDNSNVEDVVRAKLAKPIVINGISVVPVGAEVVGSVLKATQSGRVKGRASLAFRFNRLRSGKETHDIRTARIAREAEATKGEDAKKVGIGAGAGALIGAIARGKKGAAVGGAVGAGAGTGVVVATRGEEVRLAAGTAVRTTLEEPITIQVPID